MKIITEENIILFDGLKPITVHKTNPSWDDVLALALDDKIEEAIKASKGAVSTTVKQIEGSSTLSVTNEGNILYMGEEIEPLISNRVLGLISLGKPITVFENFIKNLMKNPSYRARKELYRFLEACHLPITEDGCFVAYKKVNNEYKDVYTGKINNNIGAVVEMPRHKVNDDCNMTCSEGLHFSSYSYANSFSKGPLMAVKINPADVVSIPVDYDNEKGRCCKYEVLEEVERDVLTNENYFEESQEDDCNEEDYGYYED